MAISILYLISTAFLVVSFLVYKKTDKDLNFIKWFIISIASLYGYNVFLGMIIGEGGGQGGKEEEKRRGGEEERRRRG